MGEDSIYEGNSLNSLLIKNKLNSICDCAMRIAEDFNRAAITLDQLFQTFTQRMLLITPDLMYYSEEIQLGVRRLHNHVSEYKI